MRVSGLAVVALASLAVLAPAVSPRAEDPAAPSGSAVDRPAEAAKQDAPPPKQDEVPAKWDGPSATRDEPTAARDAELDDALKRGEVRSLPPTRRPGLVVGIDAATAATAAENNVRGPVFETPRWGDQAGIDVGTAASEVRLLLPHPPPRRETAVNPDADR